MVGERYPLALETKRRTTIPNEVFWDTAIEGFQFALDELEKTYGKPPNFVRKIGYVPTYNCHGLTFAARRTMILSGEVPRILAEDGYRKFERSDACAGDVVVYFNSDGDAEHSGILVHREGLLMLVLSKFGSLHEIIHHLDVLPDYSFERKEFWRVVE